MDSTTNGIHLVDIHGNPIREPGPADWPESIELDAIHYEISDPDVMAELEAAAIEAETDRRDAFDAWLDQISPEELAMAAAGLPLG